MSKKTETVSLRAIALAFTDAQVAAMVKKIKAAIEERAKHEDASALSWSRESNRVLNASGAVARLFLALDIEPKNVILRKVNSNSFFNAKALKKVVDLAQLVCGAKSVLQIERVLTAFIACAIVFDERQTKGDAIANRFNKSFLSSVKFDQIVSDAELAQYLADYQHTFMSGGKDTQSSQARNVLDVLNLGQIVTAENRARGGVIINREHAFYSLFSEELAKA